ncbi:hypothetical protein D3C81_2155300 [compost metagenome]
MVSFIVAVLPATGVMFSAVAAGVATPAWLNTTACAPALFSFRFTCATPSTKSTLILLGEAAKAVLPKLPYVPSGATP